MRYQVQREIEGRDASDGTKRKTFDDSPAPGSRLLPVQWQIFTVAANRLFGGDVECKDCAVNLRTRALDGFARFERNRSREFFFAVVNAGSNVAQNPLPLEGR